MRNQPLVALPASKEPLLGLEPPCPGLDPTCSSHKEPSTAPPFETSPGQIQERSPSAITVRIRTWSHLVPAAGVDERHVDAGFVLGKLPRLIQPLLHLCFLAFKERTDL